MAGKKGMGLGNMNAAKHHWRSFFRRLKLREEDGWVRVEVQRYAAGLMSDKPDASEGEKHCIELASEAKAARLMIWHALAQSGFTRRGRDGLMLTPAAAELPRFIGVELGALKLLGLERRAKSVQSLASYLELQKEPDAGEKTTTPIPTKGMA